jgi:hypothetical protein
MFQVRTIQLSLLHISVMLHLHYVTHASLLNQSLNTSNVGGRRITGTLTRHLVVTTNLTYPIQYQTQKTNIGLELISPYNAESTKNTFIFNTFVFCQVGRVLFANFGIITAQVKLTF